MKKKKMKANKQEESWNKGNEDTEIEEILLKLILL